MTYASRDGDTASDAAVGLWKAVRQSAQASQLVSCAEPSSSVLTLDYLAAVEISLTNGGTTITPDSTVTGFTLDAANPGPWGDAIVASLDTDGITEAVAARYGIEASKLFNLTAMLDDGSSTFSERFVAVTLAEDGGAQRLDRVLASQSVLLRLTDPALLGGDPPVNAEGGAFAQGAFAGTSAAQAYFVKCDATTTTPADQAAGIVNVSVGFAPIYPAEFVVITISQQTASSG